MKIQVYIPSFNRPADVTTHRLFRSPQIVVKESQAESYRENFGDAVRVISDERDGSIARARNAILELAEEDGVDWLLMADDDYKYMAYFENGGQRRHMDVEEIEDFLLNGCVMADELGTGLWGVNQTDGPREYREYAPFSFLAPVLGTWHAVRVGSGLRYDESITLKEDYDFWLQAIQRWHKTLRFNKYHYKVGHIQQAGGVASYRTKEAEAENMLGFQRKWGSKIVQYNPHRRSTNPKVRVPLRGI